MNANRHWQGKLDLAREFLTKETNPRKRVAFAKIYMWFQHPGAGTKWHTHPLDFMLNHIHPQSVLEIGGGYGTLAALFREYTDCDYTIADFPPRRHVMNGLRSSIINVIISTHSIMQRSLLITRRPMVSNR
jgi:hypothetical protein